MPAGADDPRQVVALVDPARVGGGPGVAQEQRAGVAVGQRLLLLRGPVDGAVRVEPDVAVGVDEPGQHPALDVDGLVDAGERRLVGEAAADTQASGRSSSGGEEDPAAQVQHGTRGRGPVAGTEGT